MEQQTTSYVTQLQAELNRLDAGKEQTRRVLEEVFARLGRRPDADLGDMFGPAEQFARDALAGRRPLCSRYLQQLAAELGDRGLSGDRIGQILAEVDEHVLDCGEDPTEAFGTPAEYAGRIAEATGRVLPAPTRHTARALLVAAISTAGTLLSVEGLVALLGGRPAALTAGVLVAVALVSVLEVGTARLVRRPTPVGVVAGVTALAGGWLAQAAVLVWFRTPVLIDVPAAAMAAAGLGLVSASLWATRSLARTTLPEPVGDPRPAASTSHPAFWDAAERDALVHGTARAAVALTAVGIALLTITVLLLR